MRRNRAHICVMRTVVTTAAAAAIRALGRDPPPLEIARAIAVIQHPEMGTVIVTPDEALDMGDLAAIHARRKLLDRLERGEAV